MWRNVPGIRMPKPEAIMGKVLLHGLRGCIQTSGEAMRKVRKRIYRHAVLFVQEVLQQGMCWARPSQDSGELRAVRSSGFSGRIAG